MLKFTKMNGAGNDFVLLDNRDGALRLDAQKIARLCDRHRGIGADGLLMVERSDDGVDFRMRYYNADGGEAEMCGNGARCFARFVNRIAGPRDAINFATQAGEIRASFVGGSVRLAMSDPKELRLNERLNLKQQTLTVDSINTGVPHAVIFVENLENASVQRLGAEIRHHAHFAPKGTNVNFAMQLDRRNIAIRTYERGVEAETLACGTGVVASALIFHEMTAAKSPVCVHVNGGETLEVSFEKGADGYHDVTLTGPADFVFDGEIAL